MGKAIAYLVHFLENLFAKLVLRAELAVQALLIFEVQ